MPPNKKIRILCIDPSVKALGWAVFRGVKCNQCKGDHKWELFKSGVIKNNKGKKDGVDWIDKLDYMVQKISEMINEHELWRTLDLVLIELPSTYSGGKGDVAANSGAIMKLMGLVMALREMIRCTGFKTMVVPVRSWKGTVPKHITQKRIKHFWDWDGDDHNEADAVGIGDWYIRKHLVKQKKKKRRPDKADRWIEALNDANGPIKIKKRRKRNE